MTSDFVSELKREHARILELFNLMEVSKRFSDKKECLKQLVEVATAHLMKEDTRLYPALERSSDMEIKKLGEVFLGIMKEYSKQFIDVTGRLLLSDDSFDEETMDVFVKIRGKIKNRITLEEIMLYPAYEKCIVEIEAP